MKIEEEIKQKKFKNSLHKAIINIIYTGNWLNYQHTIFLKSYGVSPQQFNVLRILRGQFPSPASVNLIIDRMLDKTSNVSRLIDKLKFKELVDRKECSSDRRQVDITITQKGLELLETIDLEMNKNELNFNTITAKEADDLNSLLDKIRG